MSDFKAETGPWMGVDPRKQHVCAVKDCIAPGLRQRCLYDGSLHHHGCIHYDCEAAMATNHGLDFRPGWNLLCEFHYGILSEAWVKTKEVRP